MRFSYNGPKHEEREEEEQMLRCYEKDVVSSGMQAFMT